MNSSPFLVSSQLTFIFSVRTDLKIRPRFGAHPLPWTSSPTAKASFAARLSFRVQDDTANRDQVPGNDSYVEYVDDPQGLRTPMAIATAASLL